VIPRLGRIGEGGGGVLIPPSAQPKGGNPLYLMSQGGKGGGEGLESAPYLYESKKGKRRGKPAFSI